MVDTMVVIKPFFLMGAFQITHGLELLSHFPFNYCWYILRGLEFDFDHSIKRMPNWRVCQMKKFMTFFDTIYICVLKNVHLYIAMHDLFRHHVDKG